MTKTRNLSDLLDANGDVKLGNLDNVPPSNDASALTTGTLPIARIADGDIATAKLSDSSVTTAKLNDASVSLAKLTATGTKDATTFLRGDNTFATVSSSMASAYAETSANQTIASASLIDLTNVTATITPSSTSSKILITGRVQANAADIGYGLAVVRGSTVVFESESNNEFYGMSGYVVSPYMLIDSPNTTSATTYKIQVKTYTGDSHTFQAGGNSNICLVEILG